MNGTGVLSPAERPGFGVGHLQEAIDGGLKGGEGVEHPAFQLSLCQLGEEAIDRIEPGGGGRGEMEGLARMPGQPLHDLGMLVGGVVVDNRVDQLARRHRGLANAACAVSELVTSSLRAACRREVFWYRRGPNDVTALNDGGMMEHSYLQLLQS